MSPDGNTRRVSLASLPSLASLALLAGGALVTASVWSKLPARVPTHFDLAGNADAWMDKPIGATLLLGVAVLTFALVRGGARLLPSPWRERLDASPTDVLALLVTALMVSLHLLVLYAALRPGRSIGPQLGVALGAFFLLLGLVLPRVRRNPFVGIRTTWTLTSDENWARTHRFGGACFVLGGLIAVLAGATGGGAIALTAILVSAFVPVVYSYVLSRRLQP